MEGVLLVSCVLSMGRDWCRDNDGADSAPVFSAPKYCDTTENKGAYINIGSDLKLHYHKFDAVPHPDIKPMVCRIFLAGLERNRH